MLLFARHSFISVFSVCLLCACGSGGGDSTAATTNDAGSDLAHTGTSQTTASSSQVAGAGPALSDTTALSPDDLNVYVTQDVSLPISELTFDGDLRVVKIRSALNKTLFLGQWPKGSDFDMPIYAELAAFPLMVEVFTEAQSDETVTWEVNYEG